MTGHVYVDETKRRDYVVVGALVLASEQRRVRRALQKWVLPGQRRLHMKDENDGRRRAIAAVIVNSGVRATIYDAGATDERSGTRVPHAFALSSTTQPRPVTSVWSLSRTTQWSVGIINA